jgi:2-oxoglutarate ferredoxin oxidoreductase subunit alpha
MDEAIGHPRGARHHISTAAHPRLPVPFEVASFIADHDKVFVVEQNRDAQLRSLLSTSCGVDPAKLVPILHYDGTPITARFIAGAIADRIGSSRSNPPQEAA